MEHVAADHQKDERGKMSKCQDESWREQNESKKINIARERLYEGDRVVKKRVGEAKKKWRRCGMWRCNTDTFTHRCFYTETLLRNTFTHSNFYTQTPLYTHTQRHFYTRTPLPKAIFTHKRFYTRMLLHTGAFTHKHVYTQTHLHRDAFTQTLVHGRLYTQTPFTQWRFHTPTLLHTQACIHRRFCTQTLFTSTPKTV